MEKPSKKTETAYAWLFIKASHVHKSAKLHTELKDEHTDTYAEATRVMLRPCQTKLTVSRCTLLGHG